MSLTKKEAIIIAVAMILIVLIISVTGVFYLTNHEDNSKSRKVNISSISNISLPDGPTTEAKIDTAGVNSQLLASDEKGTVEILGLLVILIQILK